MRRRGSILGFLVNLKRCDCERPYRIQTVLKEKTRRIRGAGGDELRQVQRAWITYRDRKCAFFRVHYAGGSMARWLAAQCMMDTTARRAIELRFLAMDR